MTTECRLKNGQVFRNIVDGLAGLVPFANFDFTSYGGLKIQAMDKSHVVFVSVSLGVGAWERWRCDDNMLLGFNMEEMQNILRLMNEKDQMEFSCSARDDTNATLIFQPPGEAEHSSFKIYTIDLERENLGIPDTDYQGRILLSAARFEMIVRKLSAFGDKLTIALSKLGLQFSVNGKSVKGEIKLFPTDERDEKQEEGCTIISMATIVQTFDMVFLKKMGWGAKPGDVVELKMSDQVPMCVEYRLGENAQGHLAYYLAPTIEE